QGGHHVISQLQDLFQGDPVWVIAGFQHGGIAETRVKAFRADKSSPQVEKNGLGPLHARSSGLEACSITMHRTPVTRVCLVVRPLDRYDVFGMEGQQKNYLIDMDGVLVRGTRIIAGADAFIARLIERNREFLVLTNNPQYTQKDLSYRLAGVGLKIEPRRIFTSAMATVSFLKSQKSSGTVFVVGESGLTEPLHDAGFVITDNEPYYVV